MRILVGVAGSIASYRALDFVRQLKAARHDVRVAPTRSGERFLSRAAFDAFLPGALLSPDPFSDDHRGIDHIGVARWAETILIYGATAHSLAASSLGLADDFLGLQLLAFRGPVIWVPAMNPSMWMHPATVEHVARLQARGHAFIGPIPGTVACGETGVGHVAADASILALIAAPARRSLLAGKRVLLSAGPMRTEMDGARYVQNRSSGKTALAFAREARALGAEVEVLLGPVSEEMESLFRSEFTLHTFRTVGSYAQALATAFPRCDLFLSVAAVLDFEVVPAGRKLTREELARRPELHLTIRPVPDFVAGVAVQQKPHQTIIAFAAESGTEAEIIQKARDKIIRKGTRFLLANPLWEGLGPEGDRNQFWLLEAGRADVRRFGPAPKSELAFAVWAAMLEPPEEVRAVDLAPPSAAAAAPLGVI